MASIKIYNVRNVSLGLVKKQFSVKHVLPIRLKKD